VRRWPNALGQAQIVLRRIAGAVSAAAQGARPEPDVTGAKRLRGRPRRAIGRRTEAKVATAATSVPAPVATEDALTSALRTSVAQRDGQTATLGPT
jgi:hypothetical protein